MRQRIVLTILVSCAALLAATSMVAIAVHPDVDVREPSLLIASPQLVGGTPIVVVPTTTASSDTDPTIPDTTVVEEPFSYEFLDEFPGDGKVLGVTTERGFDADFDKFAAVAGRQPNLIQVTAGWAGDEYQPWFTERIANRGAMPVISWEPWDSERESTVDQKRSEQPKFALARILEGDYDDYIDDWATGLADWGEPVALRFAHEMNGYWYPWAEGRNGNAEGTYVQTWRYVHDRFDALGANNVIWLWSPNVAYEGSNPLAQLYPGDDYVDWIGMVGYFGHGTAIPTRFPTFGELFEPTLNELAFISDKPVLITETGATERGGFKDEWITHTLEAFLDSPRVMGFIWFNVDKETDWRIASSPEAAVAFQEVAADPRFTPTGTVPALALEQSKG